MAHSPLITRTDLAYSGNYTKGREQKLRGIVIHHACATTINSVAKTFQTPGRNGSAHYCVCNKEISLMVEEENTAWHCSNWNGNSRTIGIEVCNKNLAPNYDISDESFDTLVKLVAEIALRNKFGKLQYLPDGDGTGITGHKDWKGASTSCPLKLYPRLKELCDKANAINYPTYTWKDIDKVAFVVKVDTSLIDLKTDKVVKVLKAGEPFEAVQECVKNNVTYVRTDYSKSKGIDNAVNKNDLYVPEPPKPEPTPEPTPVDPDDTPNWFKRFITALGEFFVNLFKKEK